MLIINTCYAMAEKSAEVRSAEVRSAEVRVQTILDVDLQHTNLTSFKSISDWFTFVL